MNKQITNAKEIFKTGSVTFFTASLFFPATVKRDVFDLYAFVRVFDNFVDAVPQQREEYFELKALYINALSGVPSGNDVVDRFVKLQRAYSFDQSWVHAFFHSMELDLAPLKYQTLAQTKEYMYGSAEVIGLMMAQIMQLPIVAHPYAQKLGRAFQYMNMIRDIAEDAQFGRVYLPAEEYNKYGLSDIYKNTATAHPKEFSSFIKAQINTYRQWRSEAQVGFKHIPVRYRRPIAAATELFDYTMDRIYEEPLLVFTQKIKPSRTRAMATVVKQFFKI